MPQIDFIKDGRQTSVTPTEPLPVLATVTADSSVAARTPTITSVASSATSVLVLAQNINRKGFSVYNESTAKLRLSHSNPATNGNHFVTLESGGYYAEDQQAYVTAAVYGIWSAANGSAQVRELS